MSDQEQKGRQVDARVISLYSKGTQDSRFLPKTHFYKSYMKYLAIDIQEASTAIPVKDKNEPVWEDSPFLAAYRSAFGGNEENDDAFKQVILAFTDIDPDGKDGYPKDAVERFWSDEAPILFISLINVSDAAELAAISKQIRGRADETHPRTLVYFTFDNCDLIVFHKGDRFGDYADQLFRLCFQEEFQLRERTAGDALIMPPSLSFSLRNTKLPGFPPAEERKTRYIFQNSCPD